MAHHTYETDFKSPESLAEFRQLVRQAERCFEIEPLIDEQEGCLAGAARDRQYENLGKYIARESQILIALWDGIPSNKVGGTAEIVKFQLQGVQTKSHYDLEPPELFPVYHIVTPRKRNPNPPGQPFQLLKKYPDGFNSQKSARAYYDKIFHNLDDFNQGIVHGGDSLVAEVVHSRDALVGEFGEADLSPAETVDLNRYAVADALAQRFQRRMLRMDAALHWLVFAAFLCFVLFAHLSEYRLWFLSSSLFVLLIASSIFWLCRRTRLDSKSQDYRAIAEGSRVRFFWHLAGVHELVADNYLGKQRTELDWIRNGLRGWELETHLAPQVGKFTSKERMDAVRRLWIIGQIKYFHQAAESNKKKLEEMEMLVKTCTVLFLVIAVAMLGILKHFGSGEEAWKSWLIIAIDFFVGAGALLHHAIHQRAYVQHEKQFRRMETVFQNARRLIDRRLEADDLAGVLEGLSRLGQEALSENGDWVLLHRDRPVDFPHP